MPAKATSAAAKKDGERATITLDLQGCARCGGEGHEDIVFRALTNPITAEGGDFTHWSLCPSNGEPILLRWTATQGQ